MTLDPKDLTAATAALTAELAGVDACKPDWTLADQARYVRVLIEDGIDELARNDDAHYDYVADCVLLAGQNMQDARLQLIEERLDAVENPPRRSRSWPSTRRSCSASSWPSSSAPRSPCRA
jgi:hypothetical protein